MEFVNYQPTKIIFGENKIDLLETLILQYGKKAFIIGPIVCDAIIPLFNRIEKNISNKISFKTPILLLVLEAVLYSMFQKSALFFIITHITLGSICLIHLRASVKIMNKSIINCLWLQFLQHLGQDRNVHKPAYWRILTISRRQFFIKTCMQP